jgi:hypothetical protein
MKSNDSAAFEVTTLATRCQGVMKKEEGIATNQKQKQR